MEILFPVRGFGFYRDVRDDGLVRLRAARGVTMKEVNVGTALSKAALLSAVGDILEAPDAFISNINYDSFDEIIRDLSWLEFSNLALVLIGCSAQWSNNYAVVSQVLEICTDAHLFWRGQGRGLFVAMVD